MGYIQGGDQDYFDMDGATISRLSRHSQGPSGRYDLEKRRTDPNLSSLYCSVPVLK